MYIPTHSGYKRVNACFGGRSDVSLKSIIHTQEYVALVTRIIFSTSKKETYGD